MEITEQEKAKTLKEFSIQSKADGKPSANTEHWRLYGHPLCPYVERAKLALKHHEAEYQNVHVSLPDRPDWFYSYHRGAVPILEIPDASGTKFIAESTIVVEYVDDELKDKSPAHALFPSDPFERASRKMFLDKFRDLGLYMFRSILTTKEDKRSRDLSKIEELLSILEEELSTSGAKYLFGEEKYGFVDIILFCQVKQILILSKKIDWPIQTFPSVKKWVNRIRAEPRLKGGLNSEADFLAMIQSFKHTGVWGLKYPLAKI
ncbi:unnamed protein product [Moneuplotes crassus]|uniref:Glutathione-dependent dehydroascorbate reductase n=1 Tax=Euplotes crassus TaxID=5936 RepID=A0AAD1XSP9_EUPCR|nr:unnamed protein product [Moneuplotes crassus]